MSALATSAAAVVVGVYTLETWRLRRVAQDQFEASIAPFLTISPRAMIFDRTASELDRSGGGRSYTLTITNSGDGPALHPRFKYSSKPLARGQTEFVGGRGDEILIPIAPQGRLDLSLRIEDVFGGDPHGKVNQYESDFELVYESTSHQRYRTRVRRNADTMEVFEAEYEQLKEGSR